MKLLQHQPGDGPLPRYGDETGQTMVEYGLVLMAVALAALGAYQAFGTGVVGLVNSVTAVW